MSMLFRVLKSCGGAALCLAAASPLAAQRGRGNPPGRAARQADTSKTAASVSLDFQDQELRVVLDALAAAGELNVSLTNIPSRRVTLHMGRPVTREGMIELIRSVAEAQGLTVTQTTTLIQISGPAPTAPQRGGGNTLAQILAQQQAQVQPLRLFTYRLKHASAIQLAPVLTNLFSGAPVNTGSPVLQTGRGGATFFVPSNAVGVTSNGRGPTTITLGGGRGGRGGRGNQTAQVLQQMVNAMQRADGSLSDQAGNIRIIAEESSNSLLIRATESDFALIQQVIQGIDLRPLQVLIEVTIAEVQRTHDLDLGVSGNAKRIPRGKTDADVIATAPSLSSARDFILELVGGSGTVRYDVALAALQERGDVRVLSLPVIIAQNNRQAVLNVGSSRPFVQVSQTVPSDPTGRVETVQYIDVGTVLTITPTINPDGYVNLQIQQQDNSATNEVQFDAPVINKREATTQVFIRDGQTTVIGGLAGNTRSDNVSGIPFLSQIPVIGPLIFGRTVHNEAKTELFLFLTPHIISSDEDIDKYRDAVKSGSDLLQHVNVGPRIVPPADTLGAPAVRIDSVKKTDSLTTLRRRPPSGPPSGRTPPPDSSAMPAGSGPPEPTRPIRPLRSRQ